MVYLIRLRPLLISLGTSFGTGFFAVLVNLSGFSHYRALSLPPCAPTGWLLGAVWTLSAGLLGVSAYLIWQGESPKRQGALHFYAVQLAAHFLWPILFLTLGWNFFGFLWVLGMVLLTAWIIRRLRRGNRLAGRLQISYLIWLIFIAYLNFGTFLMN